MEDNLASKLKRKGLEDDFSDFSLSSPATKIRRLDAELLPIIEDGESEIPTDFEQLVPQVQRFDCIDASGGIKIEELPENEERAIVLFNPPNPLLHSPFDFSVSMDPQLFSGLKNQVPWSNRSSSFKLPNNEASKDSNGCLAVVPWVPSQLPSASGAEVSTQIDNFDMMDVQEMDEASMDVEDGSVTEQGNNGNEVNGMSGFHQWQQQHCLIPQPPQNTSTPLVWYR